MLFSIAISFVYLNLVTVLFEQSFYSGSVVLVIVTGNSVKISGHVCAGHAALDHAQGLKIKYDIACCEVAFFQVFAHSHDFVNLTCGFGVVG